MKFISTKRCKNNFPVPALKPAIGRIFSQIYHSRFLVAEMQRTLYGLNAVFI
jgi:hypothetical protein